ncbi:hypothetical protein FB451DRAFT_1365172 [Mycena latifolia]|nr:hypothetical protein FB451DRAFT_1365172 [Mycena latifolia]
MYHLPIIEHLLEVCRSLCALIIIRASPDDWSLIEDLRFVLTRKDDTFDTGDWQRGVFTGNDFWSRADAFMAQLTEILGTHSNERIFDSYSAVRLVLSPRLILDALQFNQCHTDNPQRSMHRECDHPNTGAPCANPNSAFERHSQTGLPSGKTSFGNFPPIFQELGRFPEFRYIAAIVDDEKLKCFKSIAPSPKQPSIGSTGHVSANGCSFLCHIVLDSTADTFGLPSPLQCIDAESEGQIDSSRLHLSNPPPILTPPLLPHCSSAVLAQHVTRPYIPPLPRLPPPAPLGTQPSAPPYALILRISDPYAVLMFPTRVLGSSTLARIHAGYISSPVVSAVVGIPHSFRCVNHPRPVSKLISFAVPRAQCYAQYFLS